MINKFRTFIV